MPKYKLTIFPALEKDMSEDDAFTTTRFETKPEMLAASYCASDLLLFLQDKLKVMEDFSNVFLMEEIVDGEWQTIED